MLEIAMESLVGAGLGDQAVFVHGQSSKSIYPNGRCGDLRPCGYLVLITAIVDFFEDARRAFPQAGRRLDSRSDKAPVGRSGIGKNAHGLAQGWQAENCAR